jgi:hypothetical protein
LVGISLSDNNTTCLSSCISAFKSPYKLNYAIITAR